MRALPPAGLVFGIDSGEYRVLPNARQMTRRSKTDVQQEADTRIIHVAACHPTSIRLAYDTLTQAVRRYPDRNRLIVAPGGNDRGAYWCIPAVLSDVLMVGAMRDNGQALQCSNWCGP